MGLIQKIALSNWGQKFYKFAADPKNEKFFNNTLPSMETILATSCYCWATHKQKNIDEDRRALLQWQNVGSGVAGFLLGSWANRKVSNYADKVIPHINKDLIPDVHKVVTGFKILLPLATTAILMRALIPSIIAWFSGKAEEVRRGRRDKKLNVKA